MSSTIVEAYHDVYPSIDPSIYSPHEFKDKVVVVTGSGSGIGKETALAFSRLGAKVAFTDWRLSAAQSAADEAKQFGNQTIVVGGDVTKLSDTEKLYETVVRELGEIDVAVFAAGYGMFDRFDVSREKDWWGLIETNLKGPTDFTRLVLPSMKKRNTGTLIYISSRAGVMDHPYSTAYSVSKAGLIRFAGCLQEELNEANSKVQVFAIHPGSVGGTQLENVNYVTKEYIRKEAPEVPERVAGLLKSILLDHTRLPAWTSVYLASGRAEVLKGRYIDATQDQQEIVDKFKEVDEKGLYLMRVDQFSTGKATPYRGAPTRTYIKS